MVNCHDKFEEVMRVPVTHTFISGAVISKKVRHAGTDKSLLQQVVSVVPLSETVGYLGQLFVSLSSVEKDPRCSLSQR